MEENGYYPIPQPNEIPDREKEDAMGAYLMMFASIGLGLPLPFINILAAIIYYFVNQNKGRFVRFHAIQSMYSQILISIINSVLIVWGFMILGGAASPGNYFYGLVLAAVIFNLIYFGISIIAAVYARKGKFFYFYFFGKFAYHLTYRKKSEKETKEYVNLPPA